MLIVDYNFIDTVIQEKVFQQLSELSKCFIVTLTTTDEVFEICSKRLKTPKFAKLESAIKNGVLKIHNVVTADIPLAATQFRTMPATTTEKNLIYLHKKMNLLAIYGEPHMVIESIKMGLNVLCPRGFYNCATRNNISISLQRENTISCAPYVTPRGDIKSSPCSFLIDSGLRCSSTWC